MHDVVIIGGGPAGLTAALYVLRAGRSALILEKNAFGGQIAYSPRVENFPGTPAMAGSGFADRLLSQVLELGAEVDVAEVSGIRARGEELSVLTAEDAVFPARAVIIATGARHRLLKVPGEAELAGSGVCYCAICDGDFYRGRRVAMVGGGNTALQEALHLSEICSQVTVIQDLPAFTGEERLVRALMEKPNVRACFGSRVTRCLGEGGELTGVLVRREGEEEETQLPVDGLFVAIGLEPENEAFADLVRLNPHGYIEAGEDCRTSAPGIFAAGDCRVKAIRQLTTAVADGTVAAMAALRHIA